MVGTKMKFATNQKNNKSPQTKNSEYSELLMMSVNISKVAADQQK